jgi:hypothetical protein
MKPPALKKFLPNLAKKRCIGDINSAFVRMLTHGGSLLLANRDGHGAEQALGDSTAPGNNERGG